ncbi:ferric reductase-like transmembrane domain-containing protein [Clostridium weizhouense]|uniref:Ferric reductase-like transmembrane domain-containing protein n=1 Tax=Clostridium weizhouense TaxID=2859781 RepID=A0ABS7AQP4_9CLOT|nr:ferric reductase-like transmembrane domain-containing protein [Clostridium weizhouense]MBW6410979.1 ferric reductase-like transmembrane domain-containing protein [Clostridium weizhouense]
MILIISLLFSLIFYLILNRQIKKKSWIFYILMIILTGFIIYYYRVKMYEVYPEWITTYLIGPFKRGAFSTATFIIVMYLGAIKKNTTIAKKMFSIRGEMSIIACISTLGHNIVYGIYYFPKLFLNPQSLPKLQLIAALLTIGMISIMLPLFITSFRCVRNKMKASTWKKIQRMAYVFFGMIYIHVMVLYSGKLDKHINDIIIYTVIFGTYAFLRIRKYMMSRKRKLEIHRNKLAALS